jgi:hypothetical protein
LAAREHRGGDEAGLGPAAWAVIAAFGAYFCMYAFRKPFTAAGYAETDLAGIPYKTVLVTAQVLGYTLSKLAGIRVIAEMNPARRAGLVLGLILAAEGALVLFGLTPPPFNFVWLFLNGLPLGLVFGLVLGFLEGRRRTEALAAGLCTSFIVADGVVKSAGGWVMAAGVPQYWMPAATGLLFLPPLLLFVWMLSRVPAPDAADEAARSERSPMSRQDRAEFLRRYGPGLLTLVGLYVLVTMLRSLRADFAPEIWAGLGVTGQPAVYGLSETVVGAAVLAANASAVFVRDNRRAFLGSLGLCGLGLVLVGVALVAQQSGVLSPFAFMVLYGLGLYLPYIAVHTTLFERLIAMTRERANIGYLMYLADASGYVGYVGLLLLRGAFGTPGDVLPTFLALSGVLVVACLVLLAPCWRYFARHPTITGALTPVARPTAADTPAGD